MSHPGPWLTPPTQTEDFVDGGTGGILPYDFFSVEDATFAAACEDGGPSEGTASIPGDIAPSTLWVIARPDGLAFYIRHQPLLLDTANIVAAHAVNYIPPTLPPTAVGYELEHPTPTLDQQAAWVESCTLACTFEVNTPTVPTQDPRALTASLRASAGDIEEFHTGAALATETLLWSGAVPTAQDTTLDVGPLTLDLPALAHAGIRTVWLAFEEQISHDDSPLIPYPSLPVPDTEGDYTPNYAGARVRLNDSFHLHLEWTPSRYRFLYDTLPPLRQFPRDDFLGGAPRQDHQSQSIQASARQGWSGTYR